MKKRNFKYLSNNLNNINNKNKFIINNHQFKRNILNKIRLKN